MYIRSANVRECSFLSLSPERALLLFVSFRRYNFLFIIFTKLLQQLLKNYLFILKRIWGSYFLPSSSSYSSTALFFIKCLEFVMKLSTDKISHSTVPVKVQKISFNLVYGFCIIIIIRHCCFCWVCTKKEPFIIFIIFSSIYFRLRLDIFSYSVAVSCVMRS